MHSLDPTPPTACSRIRAALGAQCRERGVASELGRLVRALAASKPSGTFLCLGESAGEAAAWVLDGMDLSSGLVALVRRPEEEAVVKRELERDLRASVRRQHPDSFLVDVRAHRFDLVVDLVAGEHPLALRRGLALLRPGGVCVASQVGNALQEAFAPCAADSDAPPPSLAADEFSIAPTSLAGEVLVIVRRPARIRPRRRTG